MKSFSCFFLMGLAILMSKNSLGQNASYFEVMQELQRVQNNFESPAGGFLSCNMTYQFSMESTPAKIMDSLQGQFKSSSAIKYLKIGHTETVQNDSLVITIYNDDKVIMVVPIAPFSSPHSKQGLLLGDLDSSFISSNVKDVAIIQKGNLKTLSIHFNDSSKYYNCSLVYNATTYLLQSMSYILKQSKIGESGKPTPDGALITIKYSAFSKSSFDLTTLNAGKYIAVDGKGKASVQSAYKGYNVVQQEGALNISKKYR